MDGRISVDKKLDSDKTYSYLTLSMIATLAIILLAGFFGKETSILVGNFIYFPINLAFVVISALLAIRYRKTESAAFLVCFLLSSILWLLAELTWAILELVLHEEPFPSIADFFYVAGYVPITIAFYLLVKSNSKFISWDAKIISATISTILLTPLIFLTAASQYDDLFATVISFIYPVLDVLPLFFITIILISFSPKTNRFVLLSAAGVVLTLIGDTGFAIPSIAESYYTGQPIEIFWIWGFLLFAFSVYEIKRSPSILRQILSSEQERKSIKLGQRGKFILLPVVSFLVFIFIVSSLNYFKFTHLNTSEESIMFPMLYAGLASITIFSVYEIRLQRKKSMMESKYQQLTTELPPTIDQISLIKKQLDRIEARSKRNSRLAIVSLGVVLSVFFSYIVMGTIEPPQGTEFTSGRYLIENLKGDKLTTMASWHIPSDEVLHVYLVNADVLSQQKIDVIVDAINSKETLVLPNSFMNKDPPNLSSTYYAGWSGAVQSITHDTKFPIPKSFDVHVSDNTLGEIVIILSTQKDTEGTLGFTRSIVDDENNDLIKSYITIFDVKNLDDEELAAVVRHEFGHALGLGHSTDEFDLMSHKINSHRAFISECDLDAITSLYNGEKMTEVVCRH
jgi:hypothetical protein